MTVDLTSKTGTKLLYQTRYESQDTRTALNGETTTSTFYTIDRLDHAALGKAFRDELLAAKSKVVMLQ